MKEISLANAPLNKASRIAAVITDSEIQHVSKDAINGVDILEIRVDMFSSLSPDFVKEQFLLAKTRLNKPIIGTIRHIDEGGAVLIHNRERASLYQTIIPLSDAIDIELRHSDLIRQTLSLCKANRTLLIGSYHDFTATPDNPILDNILADAESLGVDITKIVTMAQSKSDVKKMLLFLLSHPDTPLIAFLMGTIGASSRVFNPIVGSLLTYGFLSQAAAPGQLSVYELNALLNRFDPER
jgi:3-dehydroquinate dehydratase-1